MNRVGFIIYDKSFLIRKGLVSVIDKVPNARLLNQVDNEEELIDSLLKQDADLLIANETIFQNREIINLIKSKPDLQIIIITQKDSIRKEKNLEISEEIHVEETQKNILKKLNTVVGNKTTKDKKTNPLNEISTRETDILKYIALGYSNKEIADKLFISTHTVVTHRKNLTRKLGIKTVPGLTIYAILNKIIDINEKGNV